MRLLQNIWQWLLLLLSGLLLILLTPLVVLFRILYHFKGRLAPQPRLLAVKAAILGGTALLLLLILLFYFRFLPNFWASGQVVPVVVNQGESLTQIGKRLAELQLVVSPRLFKWSAKLLSLDKKIHAGKYEFKSNQSLFSILRQLSRGGATAINVTIPPGLTVDQIAGILKENIGSDSLKLVQLSQDTGLIHNLGLPLDNLEGLYYPETYNFYWKTPEEEIVKTMVDQFKGVLFQELAYKPSGIIKQELKKLVTMASLIEREGSKPEEYPLISAVFYNRLKIDMPLQSDPTILYVLPPLNRPLRPSDLEMDSPYNTYKRYGLPPTPICNPGKEALRAALQPAQVPYLYFVHKGDGTHIFSNSLAEHNRAIWQLKKENGS